MDMDATKVSIPDNAPSRKAERLSNNTCTMNTVTAASLRTGQNNSEDRIVKKKRTAEEFIGNEMMMQDGKLIEFRETKRQALAAVAITTNEAVAGRTSTKVDTAKGGGERKERTNLLAIMEDDHCHSGGGGGDDNDNDDHNGNDESAAWISSLIEPSQSSQGSQGSQFSPHSVIHLVCSQENPNSQEEDDGDDGDGDGDKAAAAEEETASHDNTDDDDQNRFIAAATNSTPLVSLILPSACITVNSVPSPECGSFVQVPETIKRDDHDDDDDSISQ